jgi:hypothetical protein
MSFGFASPRLAKFLSASAIGAMTLCSAQAAWANCTSTVGTVVCDASAPNPYTSAIGGTNVTLNAGSQLRVDPFAGASVTSTDISLWRWRPIERSIRQRHLRHLWRHRVAAGAGTTVNMSGAVTVQNGGKGISLGQGATLNLGSQSVVDVSGSNINGGSAGVVVTGTGHRQHQWHRAKRSRFGWNDHQQRRDQPDLARQLRQHGVGHRHDQRQCHRTGHRHGAASPAVILTSGSSLNIAGLVSASSAGAIDYRGTAGGSVAVNVLSGGTVRSSGSAAIIGNTGAMNLTVAGTVDAGARQPPSS